MLQIRGAVQADFASMAEVFYLAVQTTGRRAYSEAQCEAWCPSPPEAAAWARRLEGLDLVVAEKDGALVGFMGFDAATGLLDFAYVHPDHGRAGHAAALYAVIEGRARRAGLGRLTTEASRLAEPFFIAQGWRVVARQVVERRGVRLPNARMEKELGTEAADLATAASRG